MAAADQDGNANGDEARRRREPSSEEEEELVEVVGEKEERKVRARRRRRGTGLPVGLGVFGIVGWSVMVPTILGIALGIWLDERVAGPVPWTVLGLLLGLALGCLNAWYWIAREQRDITRERNGYRED